MDRAIGIVIAIAIALPAAFAACQPAGYSTSAEIDQHAADASQLSATASEPGAAEAATVSLTEEERRHLEIELAPVRLKTIGSSIIRDGIITAPQGRTGKVGPIISGRVTDILVDLGDWVEKDQPLVKIVSAEVGGALGEYYKAEAELELAEVNLERYRRLISQDIGARKDLLAAEADQKIAQANLEAAHKSLHVLGFSDEDIKNLSESHKVNPELVIRAPLTGRIVEREVTIGERVSEDSTLFTIMDLRKVFTDAKVFEHDISRVSEGQRVEISVNSLDSGAFKGKVIYISRVIDPETRTISVRTEIDNPGETLRVGMSAQVQIFMDGNFEALCIPRSAVIEDGKDNYVFVPEGAEFMLVLVQTGKCDQEWSEVLSGLREGEEIVTAGSYELYSKFKRLRGAKTITR